MTFEVDFNTKWSDFDPNRHMRHTAYNDYAAEARIRYFAHVGHPVDELAKDHIGPILFEEFTHNLIIQEKLSRPFLFCWLFLLCRGIFHL